MATSPVGEECRIYADTRRKQRKDEYKRLARIQRKIERRKNVPVFDDAKLAEVSVVRGSPFDIDQDDPTDLEPRFFLPGPVDLMEQGLENNTVEWCRLEPLHYHALKNDDIYFTQAQIYADEIMANARQRAGFCKQAARKMYGWREMMRINTRKGVPYAYHNINAPSDGGRPREPFRMHQFIDNGLYHWSGSPRAYEPHPDVPHTMGTVLDIDSPKSTDHILRSELLIAICLLKARIRAVDSSLDHRVCPVLVMSFHGRFSARVVQAHYDNGRVVVRPSRLLNMHTATVSPDVRLAVRWLLCRPVGDTRWPAAELPSGGDGTDPVEISTGEQSTERIAPGRPVTVA